MRCTIVPFLLALLAAAPAARAATPDFVGKWGSFGSGSGQFISPVGVAVGPDGDAHRRDELAGARAEGAPLAHEVGRRGARGGGGGEKSEKERNDRAPHVDSPSEGSPPRFAARLGGGSA